MTEPATLQLVLTDISAEVLAELDVHAIEHLIMAAAAEGIPDGPFDFVRVQDGYAFLHRVGDGDRVTRYRLVMD